jgi:hypothetical protein
MEYINVKSIAFYTELYPFLPSTHPNILPPLPNMFLKSSTIVPGHSHGAK